MAKPQLAHQYLETRLLQASELARALHTIKIANQQVTLVKQEAWQRLRPLYEAVHGVSAAPRPHVTLDERTAITVTRSDAQRNGAAYLMQGWSIAEKQLLWSVAAPHSMGRPFAWQRRVLAGDGRSGQLTIRHAWTGQCEAALPAQGEPLTSTRTPHGIVVATRQGAQTNVIAIDLQEHAVQPLLTTRAYELVKISADARMLLGASENWVEITDISGQQHVRIESNATIASIEITKTGDVYTVIASDAAASEAVGVQVLT